MKISYSLPLLAVSLLLAGSADAASVIKRHSANNCSFETDYSGDYWVSASAISNASGSRARNVYCPLNDADTLQYLAVDGYDANNDPYAGVPTAKVCQVENTGFTVDCGSGSVALMGGTSTGIFSTWLPSWMLTPLSNPARATWYVDLVISIPQTGIYGKSFLRGFFRT